MKVVPGTPTETFLMRRTLPCVPMLGMDHPRHSLHDLAVWPVTGL
ncbi:hypothetical protein O4H49_02305 [Kiloniella laminariae]|uniref:Uncharacterized protein n=1 Tax=Kiloniella laminariae TaxID=454162 RepID=A0ABT4LES9_9PROT|nr:hypothetical protein [Kiloniella laminariae]MCZ4279592.1 hypothetical protein [Kiloniella laminariae]